MRVTRRDVPGEASELAKLVEAYVKALEAGEFDQRLRAVEARDVRRDLESRLQAFETAQAGTIAGEVWIELRDGVLLGRWSETITQARPRGGLLPPGLRRHSPRQWARCGDTLRAGFGISRLAPRARELLVPMALHELADHRSVVHIEGSEQGGRAVRDVIVGDRPWGARVSSAGPVEGLDLASSTA